MAPVNQNSHYLRNNGKYSFIHNNQINLHPNKTLNFNTVRKTKDIFFRFRNNSSKIDSGSTHHYPSDVNIRLPYYRIANAPQNGVTQVIQKSTINVLRAKNRRRFAFESYQLEILEDEYTNSRYVERVRRAELAEALKINERYIKTWFQNRRKKDKQEAIDEITKSSAPQLPQKQLDVNHLHTNDPPLNDSDGEVRTTGPNVCASRMNAAMTKATPLLLTMSQELIPISEHYNVNASQPLQPTVSQQLRHQYPPNVSKAHCPSLIYPPSYRQVMEFKRNQNTQMLQRKSYPKVQQSYYVLNSSPPNNIHQDQTKQMESLNVHHQKTNEQFLRSPTTHEQLQNRRESTTAHEFDPRGILNIHALPETPSDR